jgi:hypothetical protein
MMKKGEMILLMYLWFMDGPDGSDLMMVTMMMGDGWMDAHPPAK